MSARRSLDDLLGAGPGPRARAVDLMVIAHVWLDRDCLAGRTPPRVSRTARRVLDYLEATPASTPAMPEAVALYYAHLADPLLAPIVALASDAVALTVADLSFLARETALLLAGSVDRSAPVEFKPVGAPTTPPWKRRGAA